MSDFRAAEILLFQIGFVLKIAVLAKCYNCLNKMYMSNCITSAQRELVCKKTEKPSLIWCYIFIHELSSRSHPVMMNPG